MWSGEKPTREKKLTLVGVLLVDRKANPNPPAPPDPLEPVIPPNNPPNTGSEPRVLSTPVSNPVTVVVAKEMTEPILHVNNQTTTQSTRLTKLCGEFSHVSNKFSWIRKIS